MHFLLYIREDIPSKELSKHTFPDDIEGIFIEANLRKQKWLFGTYHPPNQSDNYYFNHLGNALDIYNQTYKNFLLMGDFNAEDSKPCISQFLHQYEAKNLVKDKTCFKSINNPSCIDLFITNKPNSFQNTIVISTGLSDFHKMKITVLKSSFKKNKPKEMTYRNYKDFKENDFKQELKDNLISGISNYESFESIFVNVLNKYAPLKKKMIRANHVPYMTKTLRRATMNRSELESKYYKNNINENRRLYKKQKNYCSRLYKKERKNLNIKI